MRDLLENIDYVVCAICGAKFKRLSGSHLKLHNLVLKQYRELYPDTVVVSQKSFKLKSFTSRTSPRKKYKGWTAEAKQNLKNVRREFFNSEVGLDVIKKQVEKRKLLLKESNIKRSNTLKKFWQSEDAEIIKEKIRANNKNRDYSIVADSMREFWKTDRGKEIIKDYIKKNTGQKRSEETCRKIGIATKGHYVPDSVKLAVSKAQKGRKHSEEHIMKRMKGIQLSKDEGDYWENFQKGLKLRPNKFEQEVKKLLPENFQYTGDFNPNGMFKFLDGRNKNADFTMFPERTKVVECFGDYWHGVRLNNITKEDHEADVYDNYKKIGVECLIIWQHELKNLENVKERINQFILKKLKMEIFK